MVPMIVPMNAATLDGKRVLLRLDLNVPLKGGKIDESEDWKIKRVLPTIHYLKEQGAKIRIMSHLGQPKGKFDESLSLRPVAEYLENQLQRDIDFFPYVIREVAGHFETKAKIMMFENLRFDPGEELNDPEFAKALAKFGDVYVNDAFAASHRAHASIVGVTQYLPSFAGWLLQKEVDILSDTMENPERPLVVIIGGAKISTKIKLIKRFLGLADHIILGGALANTVLFARGVNVGRSLVENYIADEVIKFYLENTEIHVPIDAIVSPDSSGKSPVRQAAIGNIGNDDMILDIGPKTRYLYSGVISEASTIIWNGPMGLAEIKAFSGGTRKIAEAIKRNHESSPIIGGGDTVAIIRKMGFGEDIAYFSTGGGAMLEYLVVGDKLPGIEALMVKPVKPGYLS